MAYDLYPAVDAQYNFPPEIRQALARSLELRNDVEPMTTAIRNNLLASDLWDGRTIANTTTDRLERYDAATAQWVKQVEPADLPPPYVPDTTKLLPPGAISQYAGATAPAGWLLCQGQTVPRASYPDLFAVCGVTYGIGDGTINTFSLPNLMSKFPVGRHITDTPHNVLGGQGGLSAHAHGLSNVYACLQLRASSPQLLTRSVGTGAAWGVNTVGVLTNAYGDATITPSQGTVVQGQTDNASNTPPYLTLNYIIKT